MSSRAKGHTSVASNSADVPPAKNVSVELNLEGMDPEYAKVLERTKGQWTGLLPPQLFLNVFMADAPSDAPSDIEFPSNASSSSELAELFATYVEDTKICPGLVLHSFAYPDSSPPDDPSTFTTGQNDYSHSDEDEKNVALALEDDGTDTSLKGEEVVAESEDATGDRKTFTWHQLALMIEFKCSKSPFYSLADAKRARTIEKQDPESIFTRLMLAMYAREAFIHHQRTHLFQLLIVGNQAHFIRWDRAGAIVSCAWDYIEDPQPLVQFLWRLNHMTHRQGGWDMTARIPSTDELSRFQRAIEGWIERCGVVESIKLTFGAEDTLDSEYHAYKINVEPGRIGTRQELIIQKPLVCSRDVFGRATRAYIAYNLQSDEIVFFKDGWRIESEQNLAEDTIYSKLKRLGIPNTPRVLCAGDVALDGIEQETLLLSRHLVSVWLVSSSSSSHRYHHRVVQELAYPLEFLKSDEEFIVVLRDCCVAIQKAHRKGMLHRDFSIGNIMAKFSAAGVFEGGVLIDWDLSGTTTDRSPNRGRGTWPFLSIDILQDPSKPFEIMDDLQSLFWVLLYICMRFFDDDSPESIDLQTILLQRERAIVNGRTECLGGSMKVDFLLDRQFEDLTFTSSRMEELMKTMAIKWKKYYRLWEAIDHASCKEGLASATTKFRQYKTQMSEPQLWIDLLDEFIRGEVGEDGAVHHQVPRFLSRPTPVNLAEEICVFGALGSGLQDSPSIIPRETDEVTKACPRSHKRTHAELWSYDESLIITHTLTTPLVKRTKDMEDSTRGEDTYWAWSQTVVDVSTALPRTPPTGGRYTSRRACTSYTS
ncbi:hypothetical protein BC629DRAFT_1214987 [Irpex lacteus]|nr:hypothetical protein BC629DRAFT_1214987 [Irpex lacteus]